MRRELSAGGVVVRRMRGRWWVAAIRPAGRAPGTWALPKGLIDEGERPVQAAVREVSEETGLRCRVEVKLGDARYVYTWQGERVFKVVSFFLMHPLDGRLGHVPAGMELEVAEARWLPLDEAGRLFSYGGERLLVARARDRLDLGVA